MARSQRHQAGWPTWPDQPRPRLPLTVNGLPSSSRPASRAITGGMFLRRPASRRSFGPELLDAQLERAAVLDLDLPRAKRTGDPWKRKPTSCIDTVPLSKTNRPVTSSMQLERRDGLGARLHRAVDLQQDPDSCWGMSSRW